MFAVARSVTADAGQRDYRSYRLPRTRIDRTFFESALSAPQSDGVHRYNGAPICRNALFALLKLDPFRIDQLARLSCRSEWNAVCRPCASRPTPKPRTWTG